MLFFVETVVPLIGFRGGVTKNWQIRCFLSYRETLSIVYKAFTVSKPTHSVILPLSTNRNSVMIVSTGIVPVHAVADSVSNEFDVLYYDAL